MATRDVYLCHSKKDREAVFAVYRRLTGDGFSVWFDEKEILPGEVREARIKEGISESDIFLVCFSSTWVDERSPAHKELKLALEIMQEYPDNRVFIIPALLDQCVLPQSVKHLQWVNLFEEGGYARLRESLRVNLKSKTPVEPATGKSAARALAEALGFTLIEVDAFRGENPTQQLLLDYFRQESLLTQSHDALQAQQFEQIIEIWAYLEGNPYFTVLHPAWAFNSLIRTHIFRAKTDLCFAHVLIGVNTRDQVEQHFTVAFEILREVVQMPPFLDENSDLPEDVRRIQNIDYRDLCYMALDWYEKWIGMFIDYPYEEVREVMNALARRVEELEQITGAR